MCDVKPKQYIATTHFRVRSIKAPLIHRACHLMPLKNKWRATYSSRGSPVCFKNTPPGRLAMTSARVLSMTSDRHPSMTPH